jgi:hypothetical protein
MPDEDQLTLRQLALVYYRRGQVAHLMRQADVNTRLGRGPLCNRVPWWKEPLGTGTQDEWEKARALPLCVVCGGYVDA